MAEIINLRLARKTRQRAAAEQQSAENRARHGRTKAAKRLDQQEAERLARAVAGAKRESPDDREIGPRLAEDDG